jgi:hypothetical protein
MYIGRIITNMRKIDTIDFVEKTNKVDSIDDSIPTLIIGKELAESICGKENIRILNKKIRKNLFWTFTKLEKRSEYEKDVENFNSFVIDKLEKSVKYSFINIFYEPLSKIKRLITFIRNDARKDIYVTDKHIYINYKTYVFGISLEQTRYIDVKDKSVMKLLNEGKNNIVFQNDDFISYRLKKRIPNNLIIVPYLHFLMDN